MSRKHYTIIAKVINFVYNNAPNSAVINSVATLLADEFEKDNPRFNRSKFLSVALS
mgnify:CR=1 FL=1